MSNQTGDGSPAGAGGLTHADPPLDTDQVQRAGGVVIGVAVGDLHRPDGPAWTATDLALCVADVAAAGLPLDGNAALALLRRDLHARTLQVGPWPPLGADDVLAVAAVVALAHLRADPSTRLRALAAVLAEVGETIHGEEATLSGWSEQVVRAVLRGDGDEPRDGNDQTGAVAAAVTAAARAVERAVAAPEGLHEMLAGAGPAPAAAGALLGARLGWPPLRDACDSTVGWLRVSPEAVVGLGFLAAGVVDEPAPPVDDARPGGELPVTSWDSPSTTWPPVAHAAGTSSGHVHPSWRRLDVVLSASADAADETGKAAR